MTVKTQLQLPEKIKKAFFGEAEVAVEPIESGMINGTFIVKPHRGKSIIIQRINSIFNPGLLAEDIVSITTHLRTNGWEVPLLIPGKDGNLIQMDDSTDAQAWRAMTFIASEPPLSTDLQSTKKNMNQYGKLLGRWHSTMRTLDYEPRHTLEHFHDFKHHLGKLKHLSDKLSNTEALNLSKKVLAAVDTLPQLPDYGSQLIHGDPRVANMLFRNGKPFTFIDFDTVMAGSVWIDLGDMLRSLAETALNAHESIPLTGLVEVAESYRQVGRPTAGSQQFTQWALLAMRLIALELAIRFLNDYIEQNYFMLSQSQRLARAQLQWQIAESVSTKGNGDE